MSEKPNISTPILWIPAVNVHGGFGRWAFLEITDPWDVERTIRAAARWWGTEKRYVGSGVLAAAR